MKPSIDGAQQQSACDFTIEVVGDGMAAAAPDQAIITLGAMTEGRDVQPAQQENTKITSAIIEALTELGIPRERMQTKTYGIEPQYDYEDGKQIFRGYKVTHLLQITWDGVDGAGSVIDAAVAQGANAVTEISFAVSESEQYEEQALELAVRNAQEKAASIAGTLGVSLSAVPCRVQEIAHAEEPIRFKAAMAMGGPSTTIEPGQLTFRGSVRVWYLFA